MSVTPTPLIGIEGSPASETDVWDLSRVLMHQWADPVELETAWRTSIFPAHSVAETRRAEAGKPFRTISVRLATHDRRESQQLHSAMKRHGQARALLPLWCDATEITSDVVDGAIIPCATTYRRLFPGARLLLVDVDIGSHEAATFQHRIISAVAANQITLVSASTPYKAGGQAVPLVEVEIIPELSSVLATDWHATARLTVREVPGPSALPALTGFGGATDWPTYNGLPVFVPDLDWTGGRHEQGWLRNYRSAKVGLAEVFQLLGSKPRMTNAGEARAFSRADAWKILSLFDACRGATRTFYGVSPTALFTPILWEASTIHVNAVGPAADWDDYTHVAVVLKDGTVQVRPIGGVTRSPGGEVDSVNVSDPFTAPDTLQIDRVAVAYQGRFQDDAIRERWITDEQCELRFSTVEVLEEKSVSITDVLPPDPPAAIAEIVVEFPNGGEDWQIGSTQSIRWSSRGVTGNVSIDYSTDGGANWTSIDASVTDDGAKVWTVPNDPTVQARVRVTSINEPAATDSSDQDFTISAVPGAAAITVTSPNGAENWNIPSTHAITWTSSGVTGNVKIDLTDDDGVTWTPIAEDTANDGSFDWNTDGFAPGATYKVRVMSLTDGSIEDLSDASFTLTQQPQLKITKPNGGESYSVGDVISIQWISLATTDQVKLEYSTDDGANWLDLDTVVTNDEARLWNTTGLPASTQYRLRITLLTDPGVTDTNDAAFSITDRKTITIASPNGGEVIAPDTTHAITWSTANIGAAEDLKIEYSANGQDWTFLTDVNAADGTWDWDTTDETASAAALIRITLISDPAVWDVSDKPFTLGATSTDYAFRQVTDGTNTATAEAGNETLTVEGAGNVEATVTPGTRTLTIRDVRTVVTVSPVAGVVTLDLDDAEDFIIEATDDFELQCTGAATGRRLARVLIIQDVTGSRLMTLGAMMDKGTFTDANLALTTTAGKMDWLGITKDSSSSKYHVVAIRKNYGA